MITHRPVMGSFLNSGKIPPRTKNDKIWKSDSTRKRGFILLFPATLKNQEEHARFRSWGKCAFVQADHGMPPGWRLNRQDIETEWSAPGTVFSEELPCNARKMPPLIVSDRVFGRAELASRSRSRLYLDKRDRRAIVSHQVDFALHPAIGKVSRDHHVSLTPQIPIRIRLAANARSARSLLRCLP